MVGEKGREGGYEREVDKREGRIGEGLTRSTS